MSLDADLDVVLAAVVAGPADDGPRLAWADLIDRLADGTPAWSNASELRDRARYVRLSVELAAMGRQPSQDEGDWLRWIAAHALPRWQMREVLAVMTQARQSLARRALRSDKAFRELADDKEDYQPGGYRAGWSRGFVSMLEMSAEDYWRCGHLLHARNPLQKLTLDVSLLPGRCPVRCGRVAEQLAAHEGRLDQVRLINDPFAAQYVLTALSRFAPSLARRAYVP